MSQKSPLGEQLWSLLPRFYRDPPGLSPDPVSGADSAHVRRAVEVAAERAAGQHNLRELLDACGQLLDGLKGNLDRRLDDIAPDAPSGPGAQPWLLPYFAELLDTRPLAPTVEGRRREVQSAVRWRRGKGTLAVVEDIAEVVGQAPDGDAHLEVELREGWRQVLRTVRIDDPVLPASALGHAVLDAPSASERALHPGLPMGTVDFRRAGRVVRAHAPGDHVEARRSSFPNPDGASDGREPVWCRPVHPHGIPAFPGSYEDAARRTVDLRDPRPDGAGAAHPRRVRLFAPPVVGFFGHAARGRGDDGAAAPSGATSSEPSSRSEDAPEGSSSSASSSTSPSSSSSPAGPSHGSAPSTDSAYPIEAASPDGTTLTGLVHHGTLVIGPALGPVTIRASAIRWLRIETPHPVRCEGCLFERISAEGEAVPGTPDLTLIHCSVLGESKLGGVRLLASDCIFGGVGEDRLDLDLSGPGHAIRYSRVPPGLAETFAPPHRAFEVNHATPRYFSDVFGEPGCGLLTLDADPALSRGGEDGRALGVSHVFAHVRRVRAVLDRVAEHLPVGVSAAFQFDARLDCMPPLPTAPTPADRTTGQDR